jgi:hypothetical protein
MYLTIFKNKTWLANLCKFVHLFNEGSKSCRYTDVYQTLYVLNSLLVCQVKTKFVLYLKKTVKLK